MPFSAPGAAGAPGRGGRVPLSWEVRGLHTLRPCRGAERSHPVATCVWLKRHLLSGICLPVRVVCCCADRKRDQRLITGTQTPPRPWSHVSLLTRSRPLFSGFFQMLVLKPQRGPSLGVEPHSCPSRRAPVVSCPCCRAGSRLVTPGQPPGQRWDWWQPEHDGPPALPVQAGGQDHKQIALGDPQNSNPAAATTTLPLQSQMTSCCVKSCI